jgi:hypothetical protein
MRKRHQKGSLKTRNGNWSAQWGQEGHHRNTVPGKFQKMTQMERTAIPAATPLFSYSETLCSEMHL